jgi:hypothetical protein
LVIYDTRTRIVEVEFTAEVTFTLTEQERAEDILATLTADGDEQSVELDKERLRRILRGAICADRNTARVRLLLNAHPRQEKDRG